MRSFLVELSLRREANPVFLSESAMNLKSATTLHIVGVIATSKSWWNEAPDRLIVNVCAETDDHALGLAAIMRAWDGVAEASVSKVVHPDKSKQSLDFSTQGLIGEHRTDE